MLTNTDMQKIIFKLHRPNPAGVGLYTLKVLCTLNLFCTYFLIKWLLNIFLYKFAFWILLYVLK